MKKKYILSVALALLVVAGFAFLPEKPLKDRVIKALDLFSNHFLQEKVYLQLDKDYYVTGRTIRYKAYITLKQQPTQLSSILYIELLNKKGKVLQRDKRPIKDGGAYGDFELSADMPAGYYRIRAYTMWMRNFDPAFFFKKDIYIYKPLKEKGNNTAVENKNEDKNKSSDVSAEFHADFSVQFFPEGGDLVDSLKSLVAFKAIDINGMPVKVNGIIRDRDGKVIDSVHSVHDGMGSFSFTPQPGMAYEAVMSDTSGQEKVFPLPQAKPYGVVLHIEKLDAERVFFQVYRHEKDMDTDNILNIVAQTQGQVTYFAGIDFEKGYIAGVIPVKNNPAGILQVTLFTPAGVPLAERLVFIKNKEAQLSLPLQLNEISLSPRGKNEYILHLPDSVQGNFSVAVTDADQVLQSADQDNIVSNLLLTSDIKGYVYNPAWYFSKEDSATRHGLELVMLTNGWRRFAWKKILNNQFPEIKYPPEPNGLYFVGKITTTRGLPVKTGKVSLMLISPNDSTRYFMSGNAEPSGYFKVEGLSFEDSTYLYYKAMDSLHKRKPVRVEFSKGVAPEYQLFNRSVYTNTPPLSDTLKNMLRRAGDRNEKDRYISNRSILLKEVEVTADSISKKESIEDRYVSGMFKTDNGYTFDLTDEIMSYSNILQFLMGRVPGLIIGGSPSNPSVRWRGGTPGFYLDEVPTDIEQIVNIPVDNIALVKVIRPPFMGAIGGGGGAIAIYTRKGGDYRGRNVPGFLKTKVAGYTRVRQFYSPDYSEDKKVFKLEDQRATLYWNPLLKTDKKNHNLKISFYNTDITKRIRVIVEGMTADGKIVHIDKVVE